MIIAQVRQKKSRVLSDDPVIDVRDEDYDDGNIFNDDTR
jgi:hypothetical protein